MGLLDDAIREHLELKRRRGADPGEVAREQREALEAVPRNESAASGGDVAVAEDVDLDGEMADGVDGATVATQATGDGSAGDPSGGPDSTDLSSVVQETAELDMQTVLDDHEDVRLTTAAEPPEQDSLEWEVPGEAVDERDTAAGHTGHDAPMSPVAEVPAEDVLEETPDFLRETPEQDRLWFEQRPPRDFDFDK